MISANRHQLTHDPLSSYGSYQNHLSKIMWDAGMLVILLAGTEDTDRMHELVQLAWGFVVLLLREET